MIRIRNYKPSDAKEAAFVIRDTFVHYNKREGTPSAIRNYVEAYDPAVRGLDTIVEGFKRTSIFYVATDNGRVIGVVRGNERRVVNLFVLRNYHGRGLGRQLMELFEAEAKEKGSQEIKIRASLYATSFYEHLGYKKTTGVRAFSRLYGIRIQPMKKRLH